MTGRDYDSIGGAMGLEEQPDGKFTLRVMDPNCCGGCQTIEFEVSAELAAKLQEELNPQTGKDEER